MGNLDCIFVKESMPENSKKADINLENLRDEGRKTYDILSNSVFGLPMEDAAELYISRFNSSINRSCLRYALISLLLDKGLSLEEIFDPNAKKEEKLALGEEVKKASAGSKQERAAYWDKIQTVSVRHYDVLSDYAMKAAKAVEEAQPGAEMEYFKKVYPISDGFFDLLGQHIISTETFNKANAEKSYQLFKKGDEPIEETEKRIADILFKNDQLHILLRSPFAERLICESYLNSNLSDFDVNKESFLYRECVLKKHATASYEPPHDTEKTDNFVQANRIAGVMIMNRLAKKCFKQLSYAEQQVFLTTPRLLNSLSFHFKKDPFQIKYEELEKCGEYCTVTFKNKNGEIKELDLWNNEKVNTTFKELIDEVKEETERRISLGKQKIIEKLTAYIQAIPSKLPAAYPYVLSNAPDASAEIFSGILEFERRCANSVMDEKEKSDPYPYIVIGNHTAKELLSFVLKVNDMLYEDASPDQKRGMLTAIIFASLRKNIPVTAIYGNKPLGFDEAPKQMNFSLPESAGHLSYEVKGALDRVFDTIKAALPETKDAEEIDALHQQVVSKRSALVQVPMNRAYAKNRGYLKETPGAFDEIHVHEVTDRVIADTGFINRIGAEQPAGNHQPAEKKNDYVFSNGLKLSRVTAILAIAFADAQNEGVIKKGQIISQENLLQDKNFYDALNRAKQKLDQEIANQKKHPEEADRFMREVIARAIPRITAMDPTKAFPSFEKLREDSLHHAMNLRVKYELLNFVDRDTDAVTINETDNTLKEHLKTVNVTTDLEMTEFEYLKSCSCMYNLYNNKEVFNNIKRTREHAGQMIYFWGHKKENAAPVTLASMNTMNEEAAKFGKDYAAGSQTFTKKTLRGIYLRNYLKQLTEDLAHPEEIYEKLNQVKLYGAGSQKIEKLRSLYENMRFFDHDGQLLEENFVFKPKVTYAAWTPEKGLNGIMINEDGTLTQVPLDFSDQVQNTDAREMDTLIERSQMRTKAETRFERLFGLKAAPAEKMPNASEIAGSDISCSDAFNKATGRFSKDVTAALIMGAALEKEKIDQLSTASSGFGSSYEGKEYFYMTNWLMSFDERSKNFGKNHKKARNEVNTLLKNYDPANPEQRAVYEKLLRNAVKNAAFNVNGADNTYNDESCIKLYTASVVNEALQSEKESFLKTLDPQDLKNIRLGSAMYKLITMGDRALEKLYRKEYGTEKEKQELIKQAAAIKIIVQNIVDRHETENMLAYTILQTTESHRFKGTDIQKFMPRIQSDMLAPMELEFAQKAPNQYELMLSEENGAEKLIDLVVQKLVETKEGQNLMFLPDICLAGKMTELAKVNSDTAKKIQESLAGNLPKAPDVNAVLSEIAPAYIEKRDNAFEQALEAFPMMREELLDDMESRKEIEAGQRSEYNMDALTELSPQSVTPKEFDRVIHALEDCLPGIHGMGKKRMRNLTEDIGLLKQYKEKGGVANPKMYLQSTKMLKMCMELFDRADSMKDPETVRNLNRLLSGITSIKVVCSKGINDELFAKESIDAERVSTDMLDYFRDAREKLKFMQKQFEDHDPFYLPSNRLVRNFKHVLDDAVTAAEESCEKFTFDEEQRVKLQAALTALSEAASTVHDQLHPTSGVGKKRLDIMIRIGTRAANLANDYETRFHEENATFTATKQALVQQDKERIEMEKKGEIVMNEKIAQANAYQKFMDFKNKFPINASTPKALRQFYEQIPLYRRELEKMPALAEKGDYRGNMAQYLSLPIVKLVIARGILEERENAKTNYIVDALSEDPEKLYNKVLQSGSVKELIDEAAKGGDIKKYFFDHGTALKVAALQAVKPDIMKKVQEALEAQDDLENQNERKSVLEKDRGSEIGEAEEKADDVKQMVNAGRFTI